MMATWYREALNHKDVDIEMLEDMETVAGQKILDAVVEGHEYDSEAWGQLPDHLHYVDVAITKSLNWMITQHIKSI